MPDVPAVCVAARRDSHGFFAYYPRPGRVTWSFTHSGYAISVGRSKAESRHGVFVSARAKLGRTVVGYSAGVLVDLRRYEEPIDFECDMAGINDAANDAAAVIGKLGTDFWAARGRLLISELSEVLPEHRKKGLGTLLKQACVDEGIRGTTPLHLLLQPFPLEFEYVAPSEAGGRSVLPAGAWEAKLAEITAFWVKRFPFLTALDSGGERMYYFGKVPRPR